MKEIITSKGQKILVDDEDYLFLNQRKWRLDKDGYAVRATRVNKKDIYLRMHRVIMNCPKGLEVDHINSNKQDNRKLNLRICTHSQNGKNYNPKIRRGINKLRGVRFRRRHYTANIRVDGKNINLGNFKTQEEAHEAYNMACLKYHGEFAHNFKR